MHHVLSVFNSGALCAYCVHPWEVSDWEGQLLSEQTEDEMGCFGAQCAFRVDSAVMGKGEPWGDGSAHCLLSKAIEMVSVRYIRERRGSMHRLLGTAPVCITQVYHHKAAVGCKKAVLLLAEGP